MSSKVNRFLQLGKDPELHKYFSALDSKFHKYNFGTNTPILNHHLETETNFQGKPATLFFSEKSSKALQIIRDFAQKKTTYRLDKKKEDSSLEFFCLGYQDFNGDIMIDNIIFPAYTYARSLSSTNAEIYDKLFNNKTDGYTRIEGFATYFDYLRNTNMNMSEAQGKKPLALYGITKPVIEYSDSTENCIRFGEMAKSIVPGDINFEDVITGVLSISPYTITQSRDGFKYKNGSLEAILTHYKSNKSGLLTPVNITNVINCQIILNDHPHENLEISKSYQPEWDYPVISSSRIRNQN